MQFFRPVSPWQSKEETLLDAALSVGNAPAELIQQIRPPLSQISLFPPRLGYGYPADRVPGIEQVLDSYRYFPDNKDALSGGPHGWQAAARNVDSGSW